MRRLWFLVAALFLLAGAPAFGQGAQVNLWCWNGAATIGADQYKPCNSTTPLQVTVSNAASITIGAVTGTGTAGTAAANPVTVQGIAGMTPVQVAVAAGGYPSGATALTGNGTGTTGAVVGTLTGVSAKTTYICGFSVSALGGTGAVGPITIAGTITASLVYYMASTASGNNLTQTFSPCIPSGSTNTSITATTTADGSASNVAVNSWGFVQ